jgi:uncharacterized protein YbaR (Trm112 family)/SAM-dependent methyltransferase
MYPMFRSTRREFLQIENTIRECFSRSGIEPHEDSYRPALSFFEQILSGLSPRQRASRLREAQSILELNGERLFEGVNMPRGTSADRAEISLEVYERRAARNARHLELGVHTAFPGARVEEIRRSQDLGEFLRLDMDPTVETDVVADCAHLPFQDDCLDSVASDSLFEHMSLPRETILESFRVLAPGGVMKIAMPFFFTIHNYPGDYMRLTPQFLEETCRDVGFDRVHCHTYDYGGLYHTLHNASKQVLIDGSLGRAEVECATRLHYNVNVLLMLASTFDSGFHGHARNFFIGLECTAFRGGQPPARAMTTEPGASILQRMLPYLACPNTGQSLSMVSPEQLITADGRHTFAVAEGVPRLLPAGSDG